MSNLLSIMMTDELRVRILFLPDVHRSAELTETAQQVAHQDAHQSSLSASKFIIADCLRGLMMYKFDLFYPFCNGLRFC